MKPKNICLLFLLFLLPLAFLRGQTEDTLANYYYKLGVSALTKKNYDSAEKMFKKSLDEQESAQAEYGLARVYRADTSHYWWNVSRQHIKKAIQLDPNNPQYHLFYGLLAEDLYHLSWLEFDTIKDAIRQFQKTVELDSTNVIAWQRLGKIFGDDFLEYHHAGNMDFDTDSYQHLPPGLRNNGFLSQESYLRQGRTMSKQLYELLAKPVLTFDKTSKEDFRNAEIAYLEAIKNNPSNLQNYLTLSSLYEDNEMQRQGIDILKKLIKTDPENKDAHLNLGMLYYETANLDSSYLEYKKAISEMSLDEKEDFLINSVKILLEPILGDKLKKMDEKQLEEIIKLYWNLRDPLNLTEYNERILEHYSRVAYANLRFSIPDQNIKGWQTDRGQIIIRYGLPKSRLILRPDVAGGTKTHIWKYNNKTFAFISSSVIKHARLAEAGESKYWDDSEQLSEDLKKTDPSDYYPKFEGPIFSAPNAPYQFKNLARNNFTDLFVSYAIKPEVIADNNRDIPYKHSSGIFFFDSLFNKLGEYKSDIDYLSRKNKISIPDSGNLFVNTDELVAKPDSGNLSFEIIRDKDKGVAAYHGKFKLRSFNSTSLEMSDVVLASSIDLNSEIGGRINREDYSILPNPTEIFSKDQDLYIYYEVYNLAKNNNGLTDFEQTIILEKKGQPGFSIGKIVGSVLKFIGVKGENQQVGLTSRYQTNDKDSPIYLQLDMADYKPGNYLLTVKIKDNITGKESEKDVNLSWR
jgi:GWxTD domain-containing protein